MLWRKMVGREVLSVGVGIGSSLMSTLLLLGSIGIEGMSTGVCGGVGMSVCLPLVGDVALGI